MTLSTTARSWLFVPADRPERVAKALASPAHAVIADLEDAVAPAAKDAARAALQALLATDGPPLAVRINPEGTPWHAQDLALLASPRVRWVMPPKVEDAEALAALAARLQPGQQLVPLVETAAGLLAAPALARVPQVLCLAFGTLDFIADTGMADTGADLDPLRVHLVVASRAAGIGAPLDGVAVALDDEAGLAASVRRARALGMGGKLCIHPRQLETVNAGFAPNAQELAWARRVLDALAAQPHGAVAVDGKLVDRPVELRARALLGAVQAFSPAEPGDVPAVPHVP